MPLNQTKTPRTDAEVFLAVRNNRPFDADVSRQLETELNEALAQNKVVWESKEKYRIGWDNLWQKLQDSNAKRDENKRMWDGCSNRRILAEAERDQLRKLCDELVKAANFRGCCYGISVSATHSDNCTLGKAIMSYNSLPHVQSRKETK